MNGPLVTFNIGNFQISKYWSRSFDPRPNKLFSNPTQLKFYPQKSTQINDWNCINLI